MNSLSVYAAAAIGILLPFIGTALGASAVFLKKCSSSQTRAQNAGGMLFGFASGVMIAASVWSLLLPSLEMSENYGFWRFVPAVAGFAAGALILLAFEKIVPRLTSRAERLPGGRRLFLLILAVTLHNLPEGVAVGVVFAGALGGNGITLTGAMALSLGVALQNVPEGAIVSLPAAAAGSTRAHAFLLGVLSGAVEPVGALAALLAAKAAEPVLPYLLSMAAGSMLFVVTEDLIPLSRERPEQSSSVSATLSLLFGFALMMLLDTALG